VLRFTIQAKLAVFKLLFWNPITFCVLRIIKPFSKKVLQFMT